MPTMVRESSTGFTIGLRSEAARGDIGGIEGDIKARSHGYTDIGHCLTVVDINLKFIIYNIIIECSA